jgi:hypothetical protein
MHNYKQFLDVCYVYMIVSRNECGSESEKVKMPGVVLSLR